MRGIHKIAALMGLLGLGVPNAQGQDAAESALMKSNSTIAAQSAKAPARTSANAVSPASSPYLAARTGPPPDEVNRKDFEANAGTDACKLLLRSVPTGAEVFINDRLVGRTPLLILMAPGKYTIDMRGSHQESGHSAVGLMPKQTLTIAIDLKQRYPTSISIR
jgi:PEGA domain